MRITKRLTAMAAVGAVALSLAACGGSSDPETPPADNETSDSDDGDAAEPDDADDSADPADGASGTLRFAHNQTEAYPTHVAFLQFAEDLEAATDGRWTIEIFPNSTLGDQAEYLQSVGAGVIDMAVVSAPQLENLNSDYALFSLPTVFDSIDHQMGVLENDEITGELYTSLEDSNGFTVLGGLTQGSRSIYTDKPIETPADLAGLKIRVQESPVFIRMIEALGGSPTPMAYSEVYTGLQSGVIDGAENNEPSYYSQSHYEVAGYYSYTNHLLGADFFIVNSAVLDSMSDADRAAFEAGWDATWKLHTELWIQEVEASIAGAEADGATFVEVDSEAFVEALLPLIDEFLTSDSQIALYDAVRAAAE